MPGSPSHSQDCTPSPAPDQDENDEGDLQQPDPNPPQDRVQDPLVMLNLDELAEIATLQKHVRDLSFIRALRNASLDDGTGLTGDALVRLRNPPTEPLRIVNPDVELALQNFLALEHSSEEAYERIRKAIHQRFPDSSLPSLYRVKQHLVEMSGKTPIVQDMCINSCVGYTGPYLQLEDCPECGEARYTISGRKKIPRAVFNTIPVGPQLQAL